MKSPYPAPYPKRAKRHGSLDVAILLVMGILAVLLGTVVFHMASLIPCIADAAGLTWSWATAGICLGPQFLFGVIVTARWVKDKLEEGELYCWTVQKVWNFAILLIRNHYALNRKSYYLCASISFHIGMCIRNGVDTLDTWSS